MVLTAAIIFGGVKRIATISSSVVPMMAPLYLIMAVIILGMHIDMIPTVIANIYKVPLLSNQPLVGCLVL